MSTSIGIDFGTSKTLVTWVHPDTGRPEAIRMGNGRDEIPSTAYLVEDGKLVFGEDADDNAAFNYDSYARGFKMQLGESRPLLVGSGRAYCARDITAAFLRYLKERCEKEAIMREIVSAVVTVPAIFGPAQRDDLLHAAREAGFTKVDLLAEPVAAGMAFCELYPKKAFEGNVMVVDWGGGTLDLAIVSRDKNGCFDTAQGMVDGSSGIGGEDLDLDMWDLVSSALEREAGVSLAKEPLERRAIQLNEIRRAKESLSTNEKTPVTLVTTQGPKRVEISRNQFNSGIASRVEQGAAKASSLMDAARKGDCAPQFVLLVGGTCKIPRVQEVIQTSTRADCRTWQYSREAVGFGAAVAAHQETIGAYKKALEVAAADGKIDSREQVELDALAGKCNLTPVDRAAIQKTVLGSTIEELAKQQSKPDRATASSAGPNADEAQLLALAAELMQQGKLEEAQQHAQAACDICPESADAFLAKGIIQSAREMHQLAAASFTRALNIDPDNHPARERRAMSRLELGQVDEASDDFDKVLSSGENSGCRLGRAYVHIRKQRFADAFVDLKCLLEPKLLAELSVPSGGIQAVAAWLLYEKLGKGAESIELFNAALGAIESKKRQEVHDFFLWFTGARLDNGIVDQLQIWLWQACQMVHGRNTRDAAALFLRSNLAALNWAGWDKEILILIASVAAEASDDDTVLASLRQVCKTDESFDISSAASDQHIAARRGANRKLNKFFKPKIKIAENHGMFMNNVTITNESEFRVHRVNVTISYNLDGVGRKAATRTCSSLGPGEDKRWDNVFKDAGWFGGNISDVDIKVGCDEDDL